MTDVGSRMRVAAAACLVSSGLLVGGATAAVALADPDASGDTTGAGTAGRTSGESTGEPVRSAPRSAGAVAGAGSASPGRRSAAPPASTGERSDGGTVNPAEASTGTGEADSSKLSEAGVREGAGLPGDPPGEQSAEPAAAGDVKEDGTKEDDDECGWGWWPLPPDDDSSAPDGGGYGDGAPSTTPPAGRPGVPPGMNIPPPPEVVPESPVIPVVPDPQDPLPGLVAPAAAPVLAMPIIVLPPAVPSIGGAGGVPRAPAGAGAARPPAPPRGTPAERSAAPRVTDTSALPASYRAGYGEYLRTAGMPQVIAVAVPGATGIMLLTGAGGLIGYRQARAGHAIRASGAGRFSS